MIYGNLRHIESKGRSLPPMNHFARKTRPTTIDEMPNKHYQSYPCFNQKKAGTTLCTFPSGEHFQKPAHGPHSHPFPSSHLQASVAQALRTLKIVVGKGKTPSTIVTKVTMGWIPSQINSPFFHLMILWEISSNKWKSPVIHFWSLTSAV